MCGIRLTQEAQGLEPAPSLHFDLRPSGFIDCQETSEAPALVQDAPWLPGWCEVRDSRVGPRAISHELSEPPVGMHPQ